MGILITLMFLIGIALIVRTSLQVLKQKRFMFKNAAVRRQQSIAMITGFVGAILLLWALLIIMI